MDSTERFVVIGAGIIGASITYHLASRGQHVVLVDADLPGAGATRHSFAWIGRSADSVNPAAELRELARRDWRRLADEIPTLEVNWSGALTWGNYFAHDRAPRTTAVPTLEPALRDAPPEAQFSSDDGWVDPVQAAEQLVAAAQARGATTRFGSPVRRILLDQGAAAGVELDDILLPASTVIVAAGTGSSALCASVGVELPLRTAPAVMVQLHARPGLVNHIVANDAYEIRQDAAGTILMPRDYSGELTTEALSRTGEEVRRLLVQSFEGAEDARVVTTTVGWRPMPADGEPVIGPSKVAGVYIAVAHPGIALASSLGRLISDELSIDTSSALLSPYRPARFDAQAAT